MIAKYQKDGVMVEAVKLEDTATSIIECTRFVVDPRRDYHVTDTNSGLIIKFPEWRLTAEYGNYIFKNAEGQFSVMCDDVFETKYSPVLETAKEE